MNTPSADLIERLAAHRTLGQAPRDQLAWLAAHGELRRLPAGEVVVRAGDQIVDLWIVLSGHLAIRVNRGAGWRRTMEWRGGDVTGLLPYSRLQVSPGTTHTEELSEVLTVHRDHFPEMIVACHELTSILVHVMVDRARHFTSEDFHAEKMMSLGRLSAGLAHEINNPASAIVRSAERLSRAIAEAEDAFSRLGAAGLAREQRGMFQRIQASCLSHDAASVFSAIEQADREDAIEAWLAARGADPHAADALAESAVSLAMLDELAAGLDPNALGAAVGALAAACRLRRMALEIERAAGRVHTLVTAIRRFSYLDQSMTPAPVDLARSLADTVVVIGGKARKKGVRVSLDVEPDLPPVLALGGELNQVWLNLIDNAIDAVSADGLVEVTARRQADTVVVRVIDNGPGVPPELHERIFDPFFTTKPVGEGTGLGLDIARRLVVRHDGVIELDSRPGRTEFRVTLPVGAIHGQARHSDG